MNEARLATLLPVDTKNFKLFVISGTVVKTNMWSETRVSGGGGSSMTLAGYGGGSTKAIKSSVTNKREIWLKGEDGKDHHFVLGTKAGNAMEGQRLTVLYMIKMDEADKGKTIIMIRNHAQDELSSENDEATLAEAHSVGPSAMIGGGVLGVIIFLLFGFANESAVCLLIAAGCLVMALKGNKDLGRLKKLYKAKLAEIATVVSE